MVLLRYSQKRGSTVEMPLRLLPGQALHYLNEEQTKVQLIHENHYQATVAVIESSHSISVEHPYHLHCVSVAIPSHFHGICVAGELRLRLCWFYVVFAFLLCFAINLATPLRLVLN